MKYPVISFLFCMLFFTKTYTLAPEKHKADLIIFSFDRPLQLYALLESLEVYTTGIGKTMIIYRSSNETYDKAYDHVKEIFDYVTFSKQGNRPQQDFKSLTMQCLNNCPHEHVLFAVDDIILTDFIDLAHAIEAMEKANAYGFYLRLGHNIIFNYPRQAKESLPRFTELADNIYAWKFAGTTYSWRYPHTVDMTIYKKETVIKDFTRIHFSNPNNLEARWAARARNIMSRIGLCYKQSKMVNLPLNRVQNTYQNRHMNLATPEELLELFNQDLKIDITLLFQYKNKSTHMDYTPTFIKQ